MEIKRYKIKIKQTAATIMIEEKYFDIVVNQVIRQRNLLEKYIEKDKNFLYSLEPYQVKNFAPEIVKEMTMASTIAGVGPMASVAGAIAYYSVLAAKKEGAKFIVFENGGDIALCIDRTINVGIYCGEGIKNLAIKIKPDDFVERKIINKGKKEFYKQNIIGICTSSGKMGHSLSFGKADTVTVIAENPIIADAMATSICNNIKNENPDEIEKTIKNFLIPQVISIILVIGNFIGFGGKFPDITYMKIPYEMITIS